MIVPDPRDALARLATVLGTDVAMLIAVADGTVAADLAVRHPSSGFYSPADLASHRATEVEVAEAGGPVAWDLRQRPAPGPRQRPPVRDSARYFVYRLYDHDGRLLYVGSTRNPDGRIAAHRKRWPDIIATVEYDEHPSAETMLAAETAAIRAWCPPLNHAEVGA